MQQIFQHSFIEWNDHITLIFVHFNNPGKYTTQRKII